MEAKVLPITAAQDALSSARDCWGGTISGRKLQPLAPSLCDLVRDDDVVCSVEGRWFAIATEPREEQHVTHGLAAIGVLPYLPLEPKVEAHGRGKTRVVHRPFLTGYTFAKCNLTDVVWHKIMATRGVRRMLSDVNGCPLSVGDREMDIIRAAEADRYGWEQERLAKVEAERIAKAGGRSGIVWHFSKGDIVKIKNGPFAEHYATLTTAVDVHDRIRAVVSLFGRTVLIRDLSAHDVVAT